MTTSTRWSRLATRVDAAYERFDNLSSAELFDLEQDLEAGIAALDRGELRAAECYDNQWVANTFVKKLILLRFRTSVPTLVHGALGQPKWFDKLPLKFETWDAETFAQASLRVVPGAVVRSGAYVAPNAVLMPCFVNVGAWVGRGTMIDTWATVGSCAQIGSNCHISGGAGIGGVLEPIGDAPVIIEDHVFVGARAEIAEGVVVRRGAVIGMGVYIGRSTPIIDRATGELTYGEVPENAVVVAGGRKDPNNPDLTLYAAIIVKYADERTRNRTSLNADVREQAR
jgi:2,3,4,5-tetrahydropyridine-2,6-dicarboxylate N-succinyltransferase